MNPKTKHVAVICDSNGNCISLSKVKMVDDQEYNKLLNEQNEYNRKKENEKLEIKRALMARGKDVIKLYHRDILTAKSLYDNFVDRGLINDSDQFQQDFYDYIFNDKEIEIEKTPSEFQTIYRKVVSL